MVAGEMFESDICPAEDAVQAFLEYLVEPMLPAKSFLQGTPSESLQQSVAKQLHAIVLMYNYYLRKQHPQLEVLGFEAFCKLVVILKPALLAHMKLMQKSDDTELDDLEKQLSVTERTIMEACDISTKLDASKDVPNIEGWPISKVSVLLFDYKKENCFLLFSSITQGLWSVIEKDVDISHLNSEGQVEAKQMNRKRRVIRKPSKEDSSVNESALLQLAYLAVKEATGINQTDLVVSESHVVCSLSKEKTAVRFYIMYCTQSVNEAGFQVPIKDALESLQGPLVRKSSSRWIVTPAVEYFRMLPYAGIVSTWLSREVPPGLQDASVGGGNSNLNGPDRIENDSRVGEGKSNLNSPDRTGNLCTQEIHKSKNSPHIDDGLVGIFGNETESNDTESLEEKNKNVCSLTGLSGSLNRPHNMDVNQSFMVSSQNGEKCEKIAYTIQVDNYQEKMSIFRESDINGSTSNIKVKDEMEDLMVSAGITECGGKQNADAKRTYDNMLTTQDVMGVRDLVTCQTNSINLYKLQNTIASKQSDLSYTALRVLLRKRNELSIQQRKIEDEIVQCDKRIQNILSGSEDDLALKIESVIQGCHGVCLQSIPEERTYQQLEDQRSPQNFKRKRLSEAVLSMQNPCQHSSSWEGDPAPNSDDERRIQQDSRSCGRPVNDLEGGLSGSAHMDVFMQSGRPFSTSYAPGSPCKQSGGTSQPVAHPEEFNQCLEEFKPSVADRAKAYEDRKYGKMSAKCNKGLNSIESDGAYDIQVHCMKLLEAITPPLPPKQFNKAFERLLDPSVQRSFVAISDIRRNEWAWNLS